MSGILMFIFIFAVLVFILYLLFLTRFSVQAPMKALGTSILVGIIAMAMLTLVLYLNGIRYRDIKVKSSISNLLEINNEKLHRVRICLGS